MKLLVCATLVLLATTCVLGAMPVASAALGCPSPYTGVWVNTPAGPVGMCCDLNQDPSPCYNAPRHL
jgi:hypothetical protein